MNEDDGSLNSSNPGQNLDNVPGELQAPPAMTPGSGDKGRNKLTLLIVGLIALVFVAGGLYFWLLKDKKTAQKTEVAAETKTAKTIIDELKSKMEGQYENIEVNEEEAAASTPYKLTGYDYYVEIRGEDGADLEFKNKDYNYEKSELNDFDKLFAYNVKVKEAVEAWLVELGLQKTTAQPKSESPEAQRAVIYESKDGKILCGLPEPSGNQLSVTCSDIDKLVAQAEKLKPFVAAYREKEGTANKDRIIITIGEIKDSKTQGYKLMEGGLGDIEFGGGAALLFYQTPDGTWHYFTATQSELGCTDFNTEDLKKAYLGSYCYDSKQEAESTVSLN